MKGEEWMVKNEGRKKKILVVDDEENLRHMPR
jgi:hypothetical protein